VTGSESSFTKKGWDSFSVERAGESAAAAMATPARLRGFVSTKHIVLR